MTLAPMSLCFACQRFRRNLGKPTCSAFPDGIPDPILVDGYDHRHPFPGDGGTRFVRNPDRELPPGFEETVTPRDPVLLAEPGEIRTQNSKELRATAKRLIDELRNHPDRPD